MGGRVIVAETRTRSVADKPCDASSSWRLLTSDEASFSVASTVSLSARLRENGCCYRRETLAVGRHQLKDYMLLLLGL